MVSKNFVSRDLLVSVLDMKFKVLSYNIHKGFDVWGRWTLEDMGRALQTTHAEILLLQEVVGENKSLIKNYKSSPNERQFEYLADVVWPHYSYGKNAVFPDRHHGNAVLSKFPIESTHNLDISTNRFEFRGLLHAQASIVPAGGRRLHLMTTHLNLLEKGRKLQAARVIQWIQDEIPEDEPVILAGDFNDWPQGLSRIFEESLKLKECFQTLTGSHARTYPALFPRLHLDRIYYRGLRLTKAQALSGAPWSSLSDHLPLFAEFEIE